MKKQMKKLVVTLVASLTLTFNNQILSSSESKMPLNKTEETTIPLTKSTSSNATNNGASTTSNSAPKQSLSRGSSITSTYKSAPKYGELLDWWNDAQYILSIGSSAQVIDLNTGKSFYIKRTYGTNHADVETLTQSDTDILKSIWGGFSWERRPVIVNINDRYLAASMAGMPHAGVDSVPANVVTKNRSDGYGTGVNLDAIKNNGLDGVMDIHFLNSTRHKDDKKDPQHQACILKSAGK